MQTPARRSTTAPAFHAILREMIRVNLVPIDEDIELKPLRFSLLGQSTLDSDLLRPLLIPVASTVASAQFTLDYAALLKLHNCVASDEYILERFFRRAPRSPAYPFLDALDYYEQSFEVDLGCDEELLAHTATRRRNAMKRGVDFVALLKAILDSSDYVLRDKTSHEFAVLAGFRQRSARDPEPSKTIPCANRDCFARYVLKYESPDDPHVPRVVDEVYVMNRATRAFIGVCIGVYRVLTHEQVFDVVHSLEEFGCLPLSFRIPPAAYDAFVEIVDAIHRHFHWKYRLNTGLVFTCKARMAMSEYAATLPDSSGFFVPLPDGTFTLRLSSLRVIDTTSNRTYNLFEELSMHEMELQAAFADELRLRDLAATRSQKMVDLEKKHSAIVARLQDENPAFPTIPKVKRKDDRLYGVFPQTWDLCVPRSIAEVMRELDEEPVMDNSLVDEWSLRSETQVDESGYFEQVSVDSQTDKSLTDEVCGDKESLHAEDIIQTFVDNVANDPAEDKTVSATFDQTFIEIVDETVVQTKTETPVETVLQRVVETVVETVFKNFIKSVAETAVEKVAEAVVQTVEDTLAGQVLDGDTVEVAVIENVVELVRFKENVGLPKAPLPKDAAAGLARAKAEPVSATTSKLLVPVRPRFTRVAPPQAPAPTGAAPVRTSSIRLAPPQAPAPIGAAPVRTSSTRVAPPQAPAPTGAAPVRTSSTRPSAPRQGAKVAPAKAMPTRAPTAALHSGNGQKGPVVTKAWR